MEIINDLADIIALFAPPLREGNKLTLYGAGRAAEGLLKLMPKLVDEIEKIFVSEKEGNPETLCGIPIAQVKNETIDEAPKTLIIATNPFNALPILKIVQEYLPNFRVFLLSEEFSKRCVEEADLGISTIKRVNSPLKPHVLPAYEVTVSEHCNLNCVCCSHFAPLAKPAFLDIEEYKRDTKRLSELFDGIMQCVDLQGGEPLLNPRIMEYVKITRDAFPYGKIRIVTNGILVSSMAEDFWKCLQKYSVTLSATEYPINVDYKAIKEKAHLYGVEYEAMRGEKNPITMNRYPMDIKGRGWPEKNFVRCISANRCLNLRHGRMFTCPVAAKAEHLINYFGIDMKVSELDSVDMYAVADGKELMEKLSHPIPFCRYCKVDLVECDMPFSLSRRDRKEWLLD